MTLTEREIKFRKEYSSMIKTPRMLPELGVTNMTEYHLYHLARYLSRLKGVIASTGQCLQRFLDSDLGACLLAATFVIDNHMRTTGDDVFSSLWGRFSAFVDRFRGGDTEVVLDDIESSFYALCAHRHFDPWKK